MNSVPDHLTITVPELTKTTLLRVTALKGITAENAALLMVQFACRMLEDGGLKSDTDLASDLDFSAAFRTQAMKRTDQLLGVAEQVLLQSQAVHRGLRNRSFSDQTEA